MTDRIDLAKALTTCWKILDGTSIYGNRLQTGGSLPDTITSGLGSLSSTLPGALGALKSDLSRHPGFLTDNEWFFIHLRPVGNSRYKVLGVPHHIPKGTYPSPEAAIAAGQSMEASA